MLAALGMMFSFGNIAAISQEKPKVLAIVNGHKITAKEVQLAADDILPQLSDVPPKLRFPFIVEYLVERHILSQQAVREGYGNKASYKDRIIFYQSKALRDAYFAESLKPSVTEAQVREVYDREAKQIEPEDRVRVRHILVASKKEAMDILERLKKGAKFAEQAKAYSLDGSKDHGGDLGYFTSSEMVAEFSKAAYALKKPGELSGPVKTEFGWHIIQLVDRRPGGPQPYEQVKETIRMILLRKAVQKKVEELRKSSKIVYVDKDLQKFQEAARKKREELEAAKKNGGKSDNSN